MSEIPHADGGAAGFNRRIAETVRAYWQARGRAVETAVMADGGALGVRSDLVNALPTGTGRIRTRFAATVYDGRRNGRPKGTSEATIARQQRILKLLAMRQDLTTRSIAAGLGENQDRVFMHLARMERAGLVARTGAGAGAGRRAGPARWRLPDVCGEAAQERS